MSDLDNFKDSEYPGKLMVITAYEYDILGNRTKVISPLAFGYKEDDIQNRANYTNEYSYDILNRLEKITRKYGSRDVFTQYTYDAAGNQLTVMNERGYTTWYTYDKLNRVETITDPKNNQYSYTYDLAGNRLTETNAKGYTMTYEYDALNRLQTVTDAYNKVISRKVYDANGNVIKEIDAEGYQSANDDESRFGTIYTYNLGNLLVSISTPEAADKKKISNKFTYNQYGEVTKQTDALDCTTSYEYDAAGNMTKVTDALGTTTKYSYDKQGNKLTMTDGRGKLTSYAYSDFGKLKSVTNADNKTQSYKYDLEGNTACVTDKNGNNTVYAYDNRGLLLERKVLISGNSSANSSDIVSYTYDEAGNRASMTDEIGTSEYSYDENNRLIEIQKNGATQISYAYDQIGNVTKVTDLKGYEVGYTYDKSSRMETVTYGGKTTTYSYDDNGRRSSVTYAGGVSENYTFDKDNRLIKLTNVKPNGGIISEYSYTYDLVGRQLTKTDLYGITSYEYDIIGRISKVATPGKTTIYSYDKVGNRLLQQETYTSLQPSDYVDETTGKEIQYILKKSDYTYSNTNQLLKLVERMFDESNKEIARKTTKYTYDNNGNQLNQSISHTLPDNTGLRPKTTGTAYGDKLSDNSNSIDKLLEKTSYTYDGFNRLVKTETIKDGIRTTVDFTYNGDDLRVNKTTRKSNNNYSPEVTNYLYDRQNVILETDANSNIKARYIKGINYIAKADSTGKETYFLFNGHGDVVQTVDEAGAVQNQYDYDIWGNPTLTIETTSNSIRYTGEFYDEETGLYYLRARYYAPNLSRFTTEDSYWGEDDNPLSLNLYTYCMNDPIQYVDPSGHFTMRELEFYFGKEAAQKYKHEADPDPTSKGITLKDEADITTWSNDSSKATFTVGGVKKELYIDKGIVYDSWGYERGTVIDGHITVSEYEFKNLFGGSSSPGSSSSRESTLTVNSWENITSVYVRDNVNATINNYGIIDTITGGKKSNLVINNYGKVNNEVRIGENGTAVINNFNEEKDPETGKYVIGINKVTGEKHSKINAFNYGGMGEIHTGDYSKNEILNMNKESYVKWLETGFENETVASEDGIEYVDGKGRIFYTINGTKVSAEIYDQAKADAQKQIEKILAQYYYGFWHNGGYFFVEDSYAYYWYEQLKIAVHGYRYKTSTLEAALIPVSIWEGYKEATVQYGIINPILAFGAGVYLTILDKIGLKGPESPQSLKDNIELIKEWQEQTKDVATTLAKYNYIMGSDYKYLMLGSEGRDEFKDQLNKLNEQVQDRDVFRYSSEEDKKAYKIAMTSYINKIYNMNDNFKTYNKALKDTLEVIEDSVTQVEAEEINSKLDELF